MPATECPSATTLSHLVLGLMPEESASQHEAHIATCSSCQTTITNFVDGDELTSSLRIGGNTSSDISVENIAPDVAKLIPRLQKLDVRFTDNEGDEGGIDVRMLLAPPQSDDEIGRFAGYRILKYLGQGGMGIVFHAEDETLRRPVALKILNPVLAASRVACRRFERETQATAAFEHDHVVTIFQVGEERGLPYFAMQLLEGESLADRLKRDGQMTSKEVLRIGRETAKGLAAAHQRGLLHRDIKPDNIWLQEGADRICIVDFGLARLAGSESRLTAIGSVIGTPDYMAPEQAQGEDVDERCDLFSLGCLLYHCATGQVPFEKDTAVATLVAVSQQEAVPPDDLNPNLSPALSNLILRLLQKDRDDRPQSAAIVVDEIRQVEADPEAIAVPPKTSRRTGHIWTALATAALVLLLGVLIQVKTNKGTLIVETFDDSVTATIKSDRILLRDTETGHEVEVSIGENEIRPGEYEVVAQDKQSGWTFSSDRFSLLKGRNKRVEVRLKLPTEIPGEAAVADIGEDTKSDSLVDMPQLPEHPATPLRIPNPLKPVLDRGAPMSKLAMVQSPAELDGLLSWTVETNDHRGPVLCADIHPQGTVIATGGYDGTLRIWDAKTQRLQEVLYGHDTKITKVLWSPDGRFLISSSDGIDGRTLIWDAEKFLVIYRTPGKATSAAWSPDSKVVALRIGGIRFLHLDTMTVKPSFGMTGDFSRRPWSADSRFFVTLNAGAVLWDLKLREKIHTFSGDVIRAVWSMTRNELLLKRRVEADSSSTKTALRTEIWDIDKFENVPLTSIKERDGDVFAAWSATDARVAMTKDVDDGVEVRFGSVFDDLKLEFSPIVDKRKSTLPAPTVSRWSADGQSLVFLRRGRAYFGLASDLQLTAFAGHDEILNSYKVDHRADDLVVHPQRNRSFDVSEFWNLQSLTVDRADILRKLRSQSPNGAWTVHWINSEDPRNDYDFALRRVGNEEPLKKIPINSRYGNTVANWSPTSEQVAFQGEKSISIIDVEADEELQVRPRLRTHSSVSKELGISSRSRIPMPFSWSPNGDAFLWCGDKHPQIRDARTFEVVHELSIAEEIEEQPAAKKSPSGLSGLFGSRRQAEERFPWTSAADWSTDGTRIAIATSTTGAPGVSRSSKLANAPNVVTVWQRDATNDSWNPLQTFEIKQSSSQKPDAQTRPRRIRFSEDGKRLLWESPCTVGNIETGEVKSVGTDSKFQFLGWMGQRHVTLLNTVSSKEYRHRYEYGVWDVESGELSMLPRTTYQNVFHTPNSIGLTTESRTEFRGRHMELLSTLHFSQNTEGQRTAIAVNSDGHIRTGTPQPDLHFVIMQVDGQQAMFSAEEFSQRYGWKNNESVALPQSVWQRHDTTGTE